MKRHFKPANFLLIMFLLCNIQLNAQMLMGQAPLKPGNYWKYYTVSPNSLDSLGFLILDSTIVINENEYFVVSVKGFSGIGYIYLGLSSDSFYIRLDEFSEDSTYKYLKFGADLGDSWTQLHFNTLIDFAVIDTFTINAWLVNYHAKEIYVDTHGLVEIYQIWTDSLGLMYEFNVGHYEAGLAGCVINGKVYGDTAMYVTSIEDEENIIQDFKLSQNYPNPFNPLTIISYSIPERSNIQIKVYDILGRKIQELVNELKEAGEHNIQFNAESLSSGVYIYTITASNRNSILFRQSKQMILLK